MARMLIAYYSRTGHTRHMADAMAEGARSAGDIEVVTRDIKDVAARDLLDFDAVVLGSPTYYGGMAADMKRLLDDSVAFHGQLEGKVGGAFSSSANIGGGNETTIMGLLEALLIHGMVVQGVAAGDHYGPVAIGDVDDRSRGQCLSYGRSLGALTLRLHG